MNYDHKHVFKQLNFEPDDIFEGLSDVHDQVPYEDHSPPHCTINVPEPETNKN